MIAVGADQRGSIGDGKRFSVRHEEIPPKAGLPHASIYGTDLIAQLGTLTINEVALPLGERRTIQMLARPMALQEQAFALLGVPLPYVQ